MADGEQSVYLIPAVQSAKSTTHRKLVGHVEFQVSDGMPGERNHASSFFNLAEAVAFFKLVREKGWEEALKVCP